MPLKELQKPHQRSNAQRRRSELPYPICKHITTYPKNREERLIRFTVE